MFNVAAVVIDVVVFVVIVAVIDVFVVAPVVVLIAVGLLLFLFLPALVVVVVLLRLLLFLLLLFLSFLRPDRTYEIDKALKASYLFNYPFFFFVPVFSFSCQITLHVFKQAREKALMPTGTVSLEDVWRCICCFTVWILRYSHP